MPQSSRSRPRGVALALLGALMSAANMVPWQLAAEHGSPRAMVLVMLASAAVFNTLATRLSAPAAGVRFGRTALLLSLTLAVLTLLGNMLSAAAVARISGPLLSVLHRSEVILVALLAWAMIGERADRRFWIGALIAIVGLYVVKLGGIAPGAPEGAEQARTLGLLLGVGSAMCFGAMAVLTRKYIDYIEPVRVNALRLWLSVAFWFATGPLPVASDFGRPLLIYATMSGVFGPGLARLSLMFSARHLEARMTSLVTLTAPLFTLALAFAVIGSWPSDFELLGGAVLLCGIAMPLLSMLRAP